MLFPLVKITQVLFQRKNSRPGVFGKVAVCHVGMDRNRGPIWRSLAGMGWQLGGCVVGYQRGCCGKISIFFHLTLIG